MTLLSSEHTRFLVVYPVLDEMKQVVGNTILRLAEAFTTTGNVVKWQPPSHEQLRGHPQTSPEKNTQ